MHWHFLVAQTDKLSCNVWKTVNGLNPEVISQFGKLWSTPGECNKLLDLKKTDAIDIQRYNRLRCRVPQPPKLYGLPKLQKPNIPMRPIVSFCGSPTYQLSKYLTTVLKPLTDESRHKLQSTENFIDAIKTVQIPDDYKLVSFDVKSLFTSIPLQLALDCTETAINNSTN